MDEASSTLESASVLETLRTRASVRDFADRPVSDEALADILNAARQAPTARNLQAYSIVVVREEDKRRELARLAGNKKFEQKHIVQASVFVALCADLNRLERIGAQCGKTFETEGMELCLESIIDAALVGMCASIAADSLGLGSVMIGGVRKDPVGVAHALGLPKGVFVPFGLCIGWSQRNPPPKPRLDQDVVVHFESYDSTAELETTVGEYETVLRRYHKEHGGRPQTWTKHLANSLSTRHREGLSDALSDLGFYFK